MSSALRLRKRAMDEFSIIFNVAESQPFYFTGMNQFRLNSENGCGRFTIGGESPSEDV